MAKMKKGQVIKAASSKTVVVLVTTYKNHPLYKKRYISSKKYLVHDPQNKAKTNDRVIIKQSRPISKRKHWVLEQIVDLKTKTSTASKPKTQKPKTVKKTPSTSSKSKPAKPATKK